VQTIAALMSVVTRKRIILSGTPIQNNLSEFYAMSEFVNPTFFGDHTKFRNTFEAPIEQSRDSNCNEKERALGDARSAELARLASRFVLRRTAEVLQSYLPPRIEQVVFCRMSPLQTALYRALLKSKQIVSLVDHRTPGQMASALACITALVRTVCVHCARCP
jgi:SNF2 family DNA or RNA helicase